ncbi:hypothetical protein [Flavilitoribacter nigricans]|uniref:Uncharacterized protein n=1 Tax=Flavilitoribacter nigricans (strain ATCC 23147 / DSM 23189 / NBRC 102662 / NCIMB 1420 / SS-2) TaxID=1122177 RepID=A0A2D0NGA9_FLAN2|nr:hypothetical protein [Flavilitoribacter nigricans]PHN06803.1 hypothetical protein CRP01_10975 [Flavilitoribacter nigricans DSM 23189 = NBRC 102662]
MSRKWVSQWSKPASLLPGTGIKFTFFWLSLFSLVLFQAACTKETAEPIVFAFEGTLNGEALIFDDPSVILEGSGGDYATRSRFGNPVPSSRGLEFYFHFDGKPDFETIRQLDGQEILQSAEARPLLRVRVFEKPEVYYSDYGEDSNDIFRIDEVKIAEGESFSSMIYSTGRVIALTGYMKLIDEDLEVEGNFTLKLVEFE